MLQILQKIIQERVSAGLYRSGMVKILGVSQQVYSNIEAGKVKKLAAEFVRNYEKWSGHTSKIVDEKITATVDAGKQISENIEDIIGLNTALKDLYGKI
jgi:DNA-binding XRE family transcriptional regulator